MNLALVLVLCAAQSEAPAPAAEPAAAPAPAAAEQPAPTAAPTEKPEAAKPALEPAPVASTPAPATAEEKPAATVEQKGLGFKTENFAGGINLAARFAQSLNSTIPLDESGVATSPTPFETRFRVGGFLAYKGLSLNTEFDIATGAVFGTPDNTVVATRVPTPNFAIAELRQLYAQYRWETGAARIGVQTNTFGLGILANAGAADSGPGDFGMQHGGSVVARAAVLGRPFYSLGGAWRAIEPVFAFDLVVKDATANLLEGDRALQGIVGVRFNAAEDQVIGLTLIYRNARRDNGAPGERSTDAFVADLSGRWTVMRTNDSALTLAGELAAITGTTTQSRNENAEVLDVRQLGLVAKVNYKVGRFGLLFDGGFASGDQNPYDASLNNFRFDPNYKIGLVLFDQVLGYQTARSGWRGADPQLTGVAPEGIDLLPTAGSITGAWYLFPRAKYGFTEWLDVYGGPLFAFTSAQLTDPFNTRINGGTPVNYLGGTPGSFLGTELDLGVAVRFSPAKYLNVSAVLEGGVLLPGDAFKNAAGNVMGPVGMGRLRLTASL